MTSFGYWADRVPHGQFLCCLCFEGKPLEQAWTDSEGQRWDVCIECHAADQRYPGGSVPDHTEKKERDV